MFSQRSTVRNLESFPRLPPVTSIVIPYRILWCLQDEPAPAVVSGFLPWLVLPSPVVPVEAGPAQVPFITQRALQAVNRPLVVLRSSQSMMCDCHCAPF